MKFSMFFLRRNVNQKPPSCCIPQPHKHLHHSPSRETQTPPPKKNSPAAIKTARLDIRKDTEVPAPFVSQYRRSLDSFLQGVFDIGIDS